MKIIIGCANFGNIYGLERKKLNLKKIIDIISQAKKLGINHFDTASDYKKSETYLGISIRKIFKTNFFLIDTKLPKKLNSKTSYFKLEKILINSLKKIKINKINTLYIHDVKQILNQNGRKLYFNILKLKKKKIINKIGVSVYNPAELLLILHKFKIDVIQAPINILDNRFLNPLITKIVKKRKIELVARSIFLKGLLIKKPNKYHKIFLKNKKVFNFLVNFHKKGNEHALKTCIQYVLNQKIISKMIFGVSNKKQILDLVKFIKIKKKFTNLSTPNIEDLRLLDPRTWPN